MESGDLLVRDTGEQTSLCDTESGASGHESWVVLDDAHKTANNTPGNHDGRDPDGRAGGLHHQVGRDLSCDVERKEDGQCILCYS